jgi:glutaredoxin 2
LALKEQMNSMREIQRRCEADLKTRDKSLVEVNATNSKLKAETIQLLNKIKEFTL